MSAPLFLLGAGFNADAKAEAGSVYGESIYIGRHEIECGYPLVRDLWRLCFGLEYPPDGLSIESRFAEALGARNFEPMVQLADALMKADYYLAPRLLPTGCQPDNSYAAFFARFSSSSFLTFNYDSLVEIFLSHHGRWHPHDGFGVPVRTDFRAGRKQAAAETVSTSFVLHLHGSLCLYTSEVEFRAIPGGPRTHMQEMIPRETPDYIFDPDSIGNLFLDYARPQLLDHKPIEHRVVAPIPNKTAGLQQRFIQHVYGRAIDLLKSTGDLVAIGYSFNRHDRPSYELLLHALAAGRNPRVLLVTRNAVELGRRLAREYPRIEWCIAPVTFKSWVVRGFPGLAISHSGGSLSG